MTATEMAKRIAAWPIGRLKPYEKNARTHSARQVGKIAASIKEFGFTVPILVDENAGILAGHARLEAAKHLGLKTVPVIELTHLSPAQKKAYVLADNRLALEAGWDVDLITQELGELQALDYDLSMTGFDEKELGRFLGEPPETAPNADKQSRGRAVIRVTCLQLDVDVVLKALRDGVDGAGIVGVEITRA